MDRTDFDDKFTETLLQFGHTLEQDRFEVKTHISEFRQVLFDKLNKEKEEGR